jgi:hypothetical protein
MVRILNDSGGPIILILIEARKRRSYCLSLDHVSVDETR